MGRSVGKEYFGFELEPVDLQVLKRRAKDEERTPSGMLRVILHDWIARDAPARRLKEQILAKAEVFSTATPKPSARKVKKST